jgi:hypothetical protein
MKPSKRPAGPALYWHPDFRVVATLPDTKVIRTSFIVNFFAVTIVLLIGYLVMRQEMVLSDVHAQIGEWTSKTAAQTPRFTKATQLQREFGEGEKRVRQIQEFVAPRVVASDFLLLVAETLPRLITLDVIEMYGDGVRLRGTVAGASASLAQAYTDQLAVHPAIVAMTESVRLRSQNRDQAGNRFTFEIEMKFKGQTAAPAPKPARVPQPKNQDE